MRPIIGERSPRIECLMPSFFPPVVAKKKTQSMQFIREMEFDMKLIHSLAAFIGYRKWNDAKF